MAITSPPVYGNVAIVGNGRTTVTNITAATVIKPVPGRVARVSVIVAGTTAGTVNNCVTTGTAAVANQVASIPNAVANLIIDMVCSAGIVVVPGAGQTLAVSYS
jgi:hypothetical protein